MNKKIIKRSVWILLICIILFIVSAIIIAQFNKDKIKSIFIAGINKYLSTEATFKDFDFSLLEKFPNASVKFYHVVIKDATPEKKDTLLKAETVYLQFNLFDLIDKKYIIKNIEVKNGFTRIIIYSNGYDNYHCWKETKGDTSKSFEINLKKIVLKNMNISYNSFSNNQHYSLNVKNSILKGKFSDKQNSIQVNASTFIHFITSNEITYIKNKTSDIDFLLHTDYDKGMFKIDDGNIQVGNLFFTTNGVLTLPVNPLHAKYIDFNIIGKNLKLQPFLDEFPEQYKQYLQDYKSSGEISFSMKVKGHFEGDYLPEMSAKFSLKDAEIEESKTSVKLRNINLNGNYTTGESSNLESNKLILKNFSASLGSGTIKGSFMMKNFIHPEVTLIGSANMDFEDIKNFISLDTLTSLNGKLNLDLAFSSTIENIHHFIPADFIHSKTDGTIKIQNSNFQLKQNPLKYTDFNADLTFNNNDINIQNLSGNISKTNFAINGEMINILSFIFLPNQKLTVNGSFKSKFVDLNELLADKQTSNDNNYKLIFSPNLEFNLKTEVNKIVFRKTICEQLTGELNYKNKRLELNSLKGTAAGGNINMSGIVDATNSNEIILKSGISFHQVDISKLFYQLENFGQKSLTSKNIHGSVSADIVFSAICKKTLKVEPASIKASADILIENGELVNYESLKSLSRFVNLDDLMNIKFSTMKNQIEIKDQMISFPSMEINSSALNITLSGKHSFKNEINYNIQLLLSELLSKKAKKVKKENELFGEEADDGLGRTTLFLRVTGTVDNPVFKYDTKGVKDKLKKDLKKERQNLKQIFKEEFGRSKKDSIVKKEKNQEKPHVQVIWDEKDDDK